MPVPRLNCDFKDGDQNTKRGGEAFGALPSLFVAFHAVLEVGEAAAIAIAHQAVHLRFKDREIAEDLCFEFIHHPHPPDSMQWSVISGQ